MGRIHVKINDRWIKAVLLTLGVNFAKLESHAFSYR